MNKQEILARLSEIKREERELYRKLAEIDSKPKRSKTATTQQSESGFMGMANAIVNAKMSR
jgi:hypothetical protein